MLARWHERWRFICPVNAAMQTDYNSPLSPGQKFLDSYLILEVEGRGATGVVYKAQHKLMERLVAVKMLSPQPGSDSEHLLKRFQQEARAASALSHSNIVTIYDFGI